jgi:hypothetical protein
LEQKEAAKSKENKEHSFDWGQIVYNYELDRLQVKHNTKPEMAMIDSLKHAGFHWSPSQGVWQRQLTNNAVYSVKRIFNL